MNTRRTITLSVAAVIVTATTISSWHTLVSKPAKQHAHERDELQASLDSFQSQRTTYQNRAQPLTDIARTAIAQDTETAQAELRRILNDIAKKHGLSNVRTTSAATRPTINPVSQARLREFRANINGRTRNTEQASFTPVSGTLSATAPLNTIYDTLATLQSQRFPLRIVELTIEPNDDPNNANLRLTIETLVFQDLPTERQTGQPLDPTDPNLTPLLAAIAQRAPFKTPSPPLPPPPPPLPDESTPPPASPPPFDNWFITAITIGKQGPQVWITHKRNGNTQQLAQGQALSNLVIHAIRDTYAIVKLNNDLFRLNLGDTLSDRTKPFTPTNIPE